MGQQWPAVGTGAAAVLGDVACGVSPFGGLPKACHRDYSPSIENRLQDWPLLLLPSIFSSIEGFPGGSELKVSARNAGDLGSIPGLGRSPGEGNGNLCLENPMDGGAWWATVHRVAKSQTPLSDFISLFQHQGLFQ